MAGRSWGDGLREVGGFNHNFRQNFTTIGIFPLSFLSFAAVASQVHLLSNPHRILQQSRSSHPMVLRSTLIMNTLSKHDSYGTPYDIDTEKGRYG